MKLRVHPLFFLSLFAYVLLGGIWRYAVAFLAVAVHELSHAFVARFAGAKGLAVTLTPYGAMMTSSGEIPHLGAVLVAGPLSNLALASALLSACWIVPELYGTFKGFLRANVMIATVNLLPAYPLDGGRLLRVLFRGKWARIFTSFCTLAVAVGAGVAGAILSNLSLLLFGAFMLSYFFAFCVKRANRCKESDPLFTLAKPDEEGALRPALVLGEDKRRRLSPREITALCLTYSRECSIKEALAKEESTLGYK